MKYKFEVKNEPDEINSIVEFFVNVPYKGRRASFGPYTFRERAEEKADKLVAAGKTKAEDVIIRQRAIAGYLF